MFDLELAISNWKQDLVAAATFSAEDLDELEEHLRTTIDEQIARGRNQEEAYAWAYYSVGSADRLAAEYGKVSRTPVWRSRVLWMLCGYLGGIVVTSSIGAVTTLSAAALASFGYGGSSLGWTAILIKAVCWASLFSLLWRFLKSPAAPASRVLASLFPWGILGIAALGYVLEFTGRGILGWSTSSRLVGEYVFTLAIGNLFLSSGVFTAALVFACSLREKPPTQFEPVARS